MEGALYNGTSQLIITRQFVHSYTFYNSRITFTLLSKDTNPFRTKVGMNDNRREGKEAMLGKGKD